MEPGGCSATAFSLPKTKYKNKNKQVFLRENLLKKRRKLITFELIQMSEKLFLDVKHVLFYSVSKTVLFFHRLGTSVIPLGDKPLMGNGYEKLYVLYKGHVICMTQ